MVGMNVSGIVTGKELKTIAQEIFTKANKHSKASTQTAAESAPAVKENPFSSFVGEMTTFMPQETKTAKKGFEQSNVQINSSLQNLVNSQAAIDNYGIVAAKKPKKLAESLSAVELPQDAVIGENRKDKSGKNPFGFFAVIPSNADEAIKDDNLDNIFGSLSNQNLGA